MAEPAQVPNPGGGPTSGRERDAGPAAPSETGSCRRVVLEGTAVAIFRTESGWAAFEDACPHAGAPLSEGAWRQGHVVCAWHGWKFDGTTGACAFGRGLPSVRVLPVREADGRLLVSLPTA